MVTYNSEKIVGRWISNKYKIYGKEVLVELNIQEKGNIIPAKINGKDINLEFVEYGGYLKCTHPDLKQGVLVYDSSRNEINLHNSVVIGANYFTDENLVTTFRRVKE